VIRAFAIDDHEMLRKGLEMVFEKTPDIRMTGQAASLEEAMGSLDPKSHDVVLLDISFPGADGLTILKTIKARFPALPVLILSVHPEDVYGMPALHGGVTRPSVMVDQTDRCHPQGRPGSCERLLAEIWFVKTRIPLSRAGKCFLPDRRGRSEGDVAGSIST
jgi:CheY-like chemotaxis protein